MHYNVLTHSCSTTEVLSRDCTGYPQASGDSVAASQAGCKNGSVGEDLESLTMLWPFLSSNM